MQQNMEAAPTAQSVRQQQQTTTALEAIAPLQAKTELTVKAVDDLMFQGPVKGMLNSMASMFGMSRLSVGELLPQKNKSNLRPFLASLNSTIEAVLDDQVSFNDFVPQLAEAIQEFQRIAEEEKN